MEATHLENSKLRQLLRSSETNIHSEENQADHSSSSCPISEIKMNKTKIEWMKTIRKLELDKNE